MSTFRGLLEKAIADQGLTYDADRAQGGLRVVAKGSKLLVQRISRRGIPVRLNAADRTLLEAFAQAYAPFSALGAMFGDTETIRRRQAARGVAARAERGEIHGLESLEKPKRMLALSEIADAEPDRIARSYTFTTDKPPTRHVVFRELPLEGGGVRPDEIGFNWPISDVELEASKHGTSFAAIREALPESRLVRDCVMHGGDPNRPIKGAATVAHFKKHVAGAAAAVDHLITTLDVRIQTRISVGLRDVYLDPLAVIFRATEDQWSAGTIRPVPTEPNRRTVISVIVELVQDEKGNWLAFHQHAPDGIVDVKVAQELSAVARGAKAQLLRVLSHVKNLHPRA